MTSNTAGYVYVLLDADHSLVKIGCTKGADGKRQKSIMRAHPSNLVNILNVKVPDRFAAEAQCHRRFKPDRRSGEWFSASVIDVINYINDEVECLEMDFEHAGVVMRAIVNKHITESYKR